MAAANVIPNFDKFKVLGDEHTAGVRWKRYLAKFDMLTIAMNIHDKPARKKALLLHVAGDEVFGILVLSLTHRREMILLKVTTL